MANTPAPVIRHTLRNCTSPLRLQRRWAQVHDVRFVATHLEPDRILNKYKAKLDQRAKVEGHESISSLKEAYREKIYDLRRSTTVIPSKSSQQQQQSLFPTPPPPPAPSGKPPSQASSPLTQKSSSASPGIRPLSSYLDLEKISTLPNKEIESIWRLRHANDPLSLCAVITLTTYNRIANTARRHPQFILPLPRSAAEDGSGDAKHSEEGFHGGSRTAADIHFLQWGFHPPTSPPVSGTNTVNTHTSTVLFTHLASYKVHGAYAQPHTTITHHLDLADSHGLVLLNGSVMQGRGVSVEEGRWLVMCLQKFYDFEGHGGGIGKEKRQGLLEKFSKGDQAFKIKELVDEAERVS